MGSIYLIFSILKLIKQKNMYLPEMSNSELTAQEVRFNREKVAATMQMAKECLVDLKLDISDTLTARLTGHIFSNTIDERQLEYNLERPTFFDWLFRRRKKVVFDFKAKDIMLNPPRTNLNKILRVYEIGSGESVYF